MRALLQAYSLVSRPVCAWKAARYRRGKKTALRAPLPVISVGNLAMGGTGKTPVVAELLGYLLGRGFRPALVTRGYRGSWEKQGGVLSDGRSIFGSAVEAGDEPVLIARRFPKAGVFIGRDRGVSCFKAEALGFDVCVLDDGFQHLRVARDLDIVLHHPAARLPLREGEKALSRAGVLLLPRESEPRRADAYRSRFPGMSVFEYDVAPDGIESGGEEPPVSLSLLRGKRVLAFAGIARPGRFFNLLEKSGAILVKRMIFPDHYAYPPAGIAGISSAVARHNPEMILTTEKDSVKIESRDRSFNGLPLSVLRIRLDLPTAFFERVRAAVAAGKAGRA